MWKPVRVVSANFLARSGEPASRFHSNYPAYRNGDIPQAELIARLPHVALIGDSVCTAMVGMLRSKATMFSQKPRFAISDQVWNFLGSSRLSPIREIRRTSEIYNPRSRNRAIVSRNMR